MKKSHGQSGKPGKSYGQAGNSGGKLGNSGINWKIRDVGFAEVNKRLDRLEIKVDRIAKI